MRAKWGVTVAVGSLPDPARAEDIPLKWANDAQSGAPRYIHDPEIVSKAARALCPGCQAELLTVLAGKPERIRPTAHFRHAAGAPRTACVMASARLAATRHLLSLGYIDLPRRRMSRWATGFSGEGYEGWVELPAERVRVSGARLVDHVAAELTLADGRTLLVDLSGERQAGEDGQAIITINLSDPALAGMDIEQLRARLRVLPPVSWCSHWRDRELIPRALANADSAARQALDAWSAEDEANFQRSVPSGSSDEGMRNLRRETLLHRIVKEILEDARSINTPPLYASVAADAPMGYPDAEDGHRTELSWWTPPSHLSFSDVEVERTLGTIIPDIVGRLATPLPPMEGLVTSKVLRGFEEDSENQIDQYPMPWPGSILVEVAVTHRVDQAKLSRIVHLDMPALELDLGALGGRMSLEGLRRLVVDGLEGKRWIHHPELRRSKKRLSAKLRAHPQVLAYRAFTATARRSQLLATPVSAWAERYLAAITAYFDANARIDELRKTEGPRHLEDLDEDSDEWADVAIAAEALEAHGLPGGADHELTHTLLKRILSMKVDRGVGYAYPNAHQVVVAIMNITSRHSTPWMSIYLIAARAFDVDVRFTPDQRTSYRAWHEKTVKHIEGKNPHFLRPAKYDDILSALFPPMARFLANGKGRAP